jgi:hypothetical protein
MKPTDEVCYRNDHCTLTISRPAPAVVTVAFVGSDVGQFGAAPFEALARYLGAPGALELFIDARGGVAATLDVSSEWALWLAQHRSSFRHVSMLTGSRFIQLSATVVRKFADLGELMRLYTDVAAFEGALASAIANGRAAE